MAATAFDRLADKDMSWIVNYPAERVFFDGWDNPDLCC